MIAYGINPAGRCRQCGALQVRFATDRMGHTVEVAAPCPCPKVAPPRPKRVQAWRAGVDAPRRLACVCQLCDEPVAGKPKVALYCEAHRKEARRAVVKRHLDKLPADAKPWTKHYQKNRRRILARERARYQKDDAERERRNEYKRRWRKLNREKVRQQKERAALRAWKKAGPTPTDKSRLYRAEVEAGVRRPRRARRNQHGERLCGNGRCRQVVTGHARMCDRCKVKLAREAAALTPSARRAA